MRYIAAAGLLAMGLALSLAPGPPVDNAAPRWIDASSESARNYARFQEDFGTDDVFVVYLQADELLPLLDQMAAFNRVLSDDPVIERVISLPQMYAGSWERLTTLARQNDAELEKMVGGPLTRALGLLDLDRGHAVLYGLAALSTTSEKASLRAAIDRQRKLAEDAGLTVRVAGNPLLNLALDRAGEQVETRSLPVLVAVCIVILLLLTRSIPITLLSMLPAGLVVRASEGAMGLTGYSANIVVNIAKPLLFVLLLAGTLHIVVGWQDALRRGLNRRTAPWYAAKTKGRAVALALLTTSTGFGSLALSDVPPIRHFGLLSACGLLGGGLYILVLFPALLRFIKVPPRFDDRLGDLAWRLCRKGMGAKAVFPILGMIVVGLGLFLAGHLTSDPHAIHYFKTGHRLRQDHEALERTGLGLATAEVVISDTRSLLSLPQLSRLEQLSETLRAYPGVAQVIDPPTLLREAAYHARGTTELRSERQLAGLLALQGDGLADFVASDHRQVRLSLLIRTMDADELGRLRETIKEAFADVFKGTGTKLMITGNYEILLSTQAGLLQTLESSLVLTGGLITILFVVFLRSLRVSLLALLPNLLPVCLNFIIMYLFDMPLDVGTSMTAAIALGIAVDDTLHFAFSWNPRDPASTARSTGRAIIMSSVVIGAGFVSLITSDFIPTQSFGILCAAAMGSALLADLLVLPPLLAWVQSYQSPSRGHHEN